MVHTPHVVRMVLRPASDNVNAVNTILHNGMSEPPNPAQSSPLHRQMCKQTTNKQSYRTEAKQNQKKKQTKTHSQPANRPTDKPRRNKHLSDTQEIQSSNIHASNHIYTDMQQLEVTRMGSNTDGRVSAAMGVTRAGTETSTVNDCAKWAEIVCLSRLAQTPSILVLGDITIQGKPC